MNSGLLCESTKCHAKDSGLMVSFDFDCFICLCEQVLKCVQTLKEVHYYNSMTCYDRNSLFVKKIILLFVEIYTLSKRHATIFIYEPAQAKT